MMLTLLATDELREAILTHPVLGVDGPPWMWGTFTHPETGQPHLIPTWDFGMHAFDMGCICRPKDDGFGIIHNAFDGREDYETNTRKRH